MRITSTASLLTLLALSQLCSTARAEEILFADSFREGLSSKWEIVGLEKSDYRVRDGGLEMRVQGKSAGKEIPCLRYLTPVPPEANVIASVKITVLNSFTVTGECAGIHLLDESGIVFSGYQQQIDGALAYRPGKPVFIGQPGEEGDGNKYGFRYTDVTKDAGPLEIVSRPGLAFFRVGPSTQGKYQHFFHSAIREAKTKRGLALVAYGAPDKADHWVRFENVQFSKP